MTGIGAVVVTLDETGSLLLVLVGITAAGAVTTGAGTCLGGVAGLTVDTDGMTIVVFVMVAGAEAGFGTGAGFGTWTGVRTGGKEGDFDGIGAEGVAVDFGVKLAFEAVLGFAVGTVCTAEGAGSLLEVVVGTILDDVTETGGGTIGLDAVAGVLNVFAFGITGELGVSSVFAGALTGTGAGARDGTFGAGLVGVDLIGTATVLLF
jgi:hypothetical protein